MHLIDGGVEMTFVREVFDCLAYVGSGDMWESSDDLVYVSARLQVVGIKYCLHRIIDRVLVHRSALHCWGRVADARLPHVRATVGCITTGTLKSRAACCYCCCYYYYNYRRHRMLPLHKRVGLLQDSQHHPSFQEYLHS